ncbi:MAG: class I SAM-dependent RNA methyltransferase [Deltaproteobacteria bacterium]|nr:class I SAM-dependent RNA methyltransferase [Deltaproteobacteria bacterium]
MNSQSLTIETLTHGPWGLGRDQGKVILVPMTVPGDQVEVEVVEEHKRYSVARLASLSRPSPARRTAPCPYAGTCGGCSWQQVAYEEQLRAKQRNVADTLTRVGGLSGFEVLPILPSPREYQYRRRIRLHVDEGGTLGFRRAFSRDLVEVANCLIADPDADQAIGVAAEWLRRLGTKVTEVEILRADRPGQVILSAITRNRLSGADAHACEDAVTGPVAGLIMGGPRWRRHWGDTTLSFVVDGDLKLRHDADTFGQVNPDGNRELLNELLSWEAFGEQDRVLELYAGAGNLTLPMARRVRRVTAVEAGRRLVQSGERNAARNDLHNIRWLRQDAVSAVEELIGQGRRFTTVVLNPPRTGAKNVAPKLAALGARRILYVSCNPATLARDLRHLAAQGFVLQRVRPVDLFPQTFHVETLAELVLPEALGPAAESDE